ncbi:hypothetical protein ACIFOT_26395 [Neobacillus sp. NRS-1170]|uniref:hypothetical protein n=1 Tax=Neobacillus sp. NRS-1170 TaxID=3233898 RepID=UPI003D2D3CBC
MPAIIRLGLLIISWLTIIYLPKESVKKYTPVATFSSLLVLVLSILSFRFKWWRVRGGVSKKIFNDFSFIFGPYFVGTIWIFHLSFGRFWLYCLINLFMDTMLLYPLNKMFEKLGMYKLTRITPEQLLYTTLSFALALYGFQLFISKPKSSE